MTEEKIERPKLRCVIFDIDISKLTPEQLKERCANCLEKTNGDQCAHIEIIKEDE